MFQTIITFIIVFSILVIIHEFGHFYFAKKAGILVREFAIGMGPKISQLTTKRFKNERSFHLNLLISSYHWPKKILNIIPSDDDHQQKQQPHSDSRDDAFLLWIQRLASDSFN